VIGYLRRLGDQRRRRALRRRRSEEIAGWICVPIIAIVCLYAWRGWELMIADRLPQHRDSVTPASIGSPPSSP